MKEWLIDDDDDGGGGKMGDELWMRKMEIDEERVKWKWISLRKMRMDRERQEDGWKKTVEKGRKRDEKEDNINKRESEKMEERGLKQRGK